MNGDQGWRIKSAILWFNLVRVRDTNIARYSTRRSRRSSRGSSRGADDTCALHPANAEMRAIGGVPGGELGEAAMWILREGGFPLLPPLPPLVNGTEYKVVACSTLGHSVAETSRVTEKKNGAPLWEFSFAGSSPGSPLSVLRGRKGTTGSTDPRDEVQIRPSIRARLPSARSSRVRRGIIKLCLELSIFLLWTTGKNNFNTDAIR